MSRLLMPLTQAEHEALLAEIKRLRAALKEIATDDYSEESLSARQPEPTMIWEAVARRALETH